MKNTMKKLAMLLCVATIAIGAISCESKAKKEAEEAAKQEALMREEMAKQNAEREAAFNEMMSGFLQICYKHGYDEGFEWGNMPGDDDLYSGILSRGLDDFSNKYYEMLRTTNFGLDYPSEIPTCVNKYKRGFKDGFDEGWKRSH